MNVSLKTLLKLLIVFTSLAFIFHSCTKIDLKNPALHEENFAGKFFATKAIPNKEVAEIIAQLKLENENTGFVNKLPAKCGLPVWDKLIVLQKDKISQKSQLSQNSISVGNTIIIPLTLNNQNLSGLLFVTQNEDNTYSINCTTQEMLDQHVHNTDAELSKN